MVIMSLEQQPLRLHYPISTPGDNGRQFFLRADYQPAQRTTGNAVNDPLDSDTVTVTVDPLIEIIAQPSNRQALIDTNTTFTVDADLTDSSYTTELSYQWALQGEDIDDGTVQRTTLVHCCRYYIHF